MPKTSVIATMSAAEKAAYERRRKVVAKTLQDRGYGAKQRLSQAMGMSPAIISSIVTGRIMSEVQLAKIEQGLGATV